MITNKFPYTTLERYTQDNGIRHYKSPEEILLPSVTTILGATGDKSALDNWRKRIGEEEAARITKLSAGIGTIFHEHMECHLNGEERPGGTSYSRTRAKILADVVIEKAMPNVGEIWGLESMVHFPGLYAGTADVIGMWKGNPAIMDFKNTRKPKQKKWIEDYYCQLCAYALAHNELYDTDIATGTIMMVAREESHLGQYQEFVIEGDEFKKWTNVWLDRVDQYYQNLDK